MEKTIKFIPGYYEWHLIIDNELVYVFNDGFQECFDDKTGLEAYVDLIIACLDEEAKRGEEEEKYDATSFCDYYGKRQEMKELWLSLNKKDKKQVAKIIKKAWSRYID